MVGEYVAVESLAEVERWLVERGLGRGYREKMAHDEGDRQADEEDMNDQLG